MQFQCVTEKRLILYYLLHNLSYQTISLPLTFDQQNLEIENNISKRREYQCIQHFS